MDAVAPGGLGGTFGGNPLACAAAIAVLDEVASDAFRERADELGARDPRRASSSSRRATRRSARCAGSGRCSPSSCAEQTPELAKAVTAAARERGLVLLSCGLYGNVIRILVPLVDRRRRCSSAASTSWRSRLATPRAG